MTDRLLIDRTLLEQALDALLHRRSGSDQVQRIDAAITDLCAALAQEQPEPAQEPVAWEDWWRSHGQYNFRATARMTFERAKELMKLAFEVGREAAPQPQQPEPSGYCTLEQLVVMQRTVPSPDKIAIYTAPPQRLAEPVQEPVAGVVLKAEGRPALVDNGTEDWHCKERNARRLYTAPPQRPPLTDAEIDEIFRDLCSTTTGASYRTMARAIERKVRGE